MGNTQARYNRRWARYNRYCVPAVYDPLWNGFVPPAVAPIAPAVAPVAPAVAPVAPAFAPVAPALAPYAPWAPANPWAPAYPAPAPALPSALSYSYPYY